jgi:transcription-repair coupling factor (superfamily II helicase)
MVIEAKSLPDPRRSRVKRRFVRLGLVLFLIACAIAADGVARSYRFYSHIIDARLANGYLTSRPGLYAAPRVLEAGQRLSREKLTAVLRRAGYLETNASDVWRGSFCVCDGALEIRPARSKEVVRVTFAGDQID